MDKRQAVRIDVYPNGGLVHETPKGEVREQQPVALLPHKIGRFATQDDLRPAQMGFQFVQGGLDLPAFVIERRQLLGRRGGGVEP